MQFDELYEGVDDYFGSNPDPLLYKHYALLGSSKPVLDIGAGQGRNAIFLAREGYTVHALDPSKVAMNTLYSKAMEEHLPITTSVTDFENYQVQAEHYSGILVLGLIQILEWDALKVLVGKLFNWCADSGYLFVTGFGTADPSFAQVQQVLPCLGPNSFRRKDGLPLTFFEPNQILQIFESYKVIYHWEGLGPEHRHGDGPVEQHALVHAIFQKS